MSPTDRPLIAFIGWGSLVWKAGTLRCIGAWRALRAGIQRRRLTGYFHSDPASPERLDARVPIQWMMSADNHATEHCVILRDPENWPSAISL